MEHLINFLESMIEQPPAKLNIEGKKDLVLSKDAQKGFRVACIIVKHMIDKNSSFETVKSGEDA